MIANRLRTWLGHLTGGTAGGEPRPEAVPRPLGSRGPARPLGSTLGDAIDIFVMMKRSEGLSPRTVDWYAYVLGQFAAWQGAATPLTAITPAEIARWINHERDRGLASVTVEGNYRGLFAFFNWCEGAPDVGKPPSPMGHGHNKTIKRPKVDQPVLDFVTFDEFLELTNAIDLATWLDYRDWCMISVLFWCGVRRGELLQLKTGDVDLAKGEITLRHTKTRQPRPAFLLPDVVAGIQHYLTVRPAWPGDDLWLAYDKARTGIAGPLSATGLRLMLARRCRRAKLRFVHPHLFRHGFAMEYLNHDAELKAVSTLLGHANVRTTEAHYAKWLNGPLRRVHQRVADRIANPE